MDDLVWRTDHWEGHIDKVTRYDEQLRDSITNNTKCSGVIVEHLSSNAYESKKKGLCIWFEDAETKKNISKRCVCWRNSDGKIRRIIGTNKEI